MNSELSRIHSLIDSDGTTHLADYTYLGRDRTVQVDFPQPGVKFTWLWQTGDNPTPPAEPYTGWDRFGRAIDLRWIKSGDDLERLQHGYDRASNRLYRKNLVAPDADKQDELYTYDGLSQLSVFQRGVLNTGRTAITGTPIAEEGFIFDPTGNWNEYVRKASGTPTTQTRTHNKANELTAIIGSTSPPVVEEDAAGNMTKVPKPDDWSSAYDLKYGAWNRLVEVKDGSAVVATYAYDGLNRRTKKVMGSDTRHFYYTDKWQIIEERVNASTSADRQFVWGIRYTDDLVLRDKGTERLYVIQDYFQPTVVMDTSGAVLERYGYEAFGTSRVMTPAYGSRDPSSYEWETRYGAYRWDGETKMLQVRNRYLHTQLGRWVTRDPLPNAEQLEDVNFYRYVENAPPNSVDPLGLGKGPLPTITGCPNCAGKVVAGHGSPGGQGQIGTLNTYALLQGNKCIGYIGCGADELNTGGITDAFKTRNVDIQEAKLEKFRNFRRMFGITEAQIVLDVIAYRVSLDIADSLDIANEGDLVATTLASVDMVLTNICKQSHCKGSVASVKVECLPGGGRANIEVSVSLGKTCGQITNRVC